MPRVDLSKEVQEIIKSGSATGLDAYKQAYQNLVDSMTPRETISDKISNLWDDITGKSQIELQNKYNLEQMQKQYEYDKQATLEKYQLEAAALENAGYNKNLAYNSSGSTVAQSAPHLEAYTGSKKVEKVVSYLSTLLHFIPGIYQASAGAEKLEQERLKTGLLGLNLKDRFLDLLDKADSRPYDLGSIFGRKGKMLSTPKIGIVSAGSSYDEYQKQLQNARLAQLQVIPNQVSILNQRKRNMVLDYNSKVARNLYDYGIDADGKYIAGGGTTTMIPFYLSRNNKGLYDAKDKELNYNLNQDWLKYQRALGVFAPAINILGGALGTFIPKTYNHNYNYNKNY